jgi:c-di-GMP-binding flagellar brake protein YcgR
LLNISSTGAAIEFFERDQLPENDSEIKLHLLLPGHTDQLSLLARVVWRRKPAEDAISQTVIMGLQFRNMDEKTRAEFWDFIVDAETSPRR